MIPLLAGLIVFGIAYDWLTALWLRAWLLHRVAIVPSFPITFFRPIKRGVPDLGMFLRDFLSVVESEDQILFGVDETDLLSQQIIQKSLDAHSQLDAHLFLCLVDLARNPKINKLRQLAPYARHDHWIVLDSEIENASVFLPVFRSEWAQTKPESVLSAPYRFRRLTLTTAPVLHTLLPGLGVLHGLEKIRHTLGACIAVTRQQIETLGGWASLGDELAEDYHLGQKLAALGYSVNYSTTVIQLANDPANFPRIHQLHRQSATYRHCQPWGFAGSLATHGLFWTLLSTCWLPLGTFWTLFAAVCLSRVVVCRLRARLLGWHLDFWSALWLPIVSSFLETFFWFLAWLPLPIRWAGKTWKI